MTRWLTEPEMRAWRALVSRTHHLMGELDKELQAEHGMTVAEYGVMALLSEAPDRSARMTDLAARENISPSGMTRRVDGLVRKGWVERVRCPEDRRGSFAVLTDAGFEQLRTAAPDHVRGVREHFVDQLSERQLANLAAALERLD